MSSTYPTSLDNFTNNTDNVDTIIAQDVNDLNDAVEALEAKVGIDSSAVSTSIDYIIRNKIWPVGSIHCSTSSTNPGTSMGFGTWSAFGAGKVMVGLDATDAAFDTAEETGGAKTHTLTGAESGEKGHNHTQDGHTHAIAIGVAGASSSPGLRSSGYQNSGAGVSTGTFDAGVATATNQAVAASSASSAHNNLQPYIVVYMWKRTA